MPVSPDSSAYATNVPAAAKTLPFELDQAKRFKSEFQTSTKYIHSRQSTIGKATADKQTFLGN